MLKNRQREQCSQKPENTLKIRGSQLIQLNFSEADPEIGFPAAVLTFSSDEGSLCVERCRTVFRDKCCEMIYNDHKHSGGGQVPAGTV